MKRPALAFALCLLLSVLSISTRAQENKPAGHDFSIVRATVRDYQRGAVKPLPLDI